MDLNSLTGHSEQVMTVITNLKNDPNFLSEFKENPQEALSKIGVELNEKELAIVQKISGLSGLEEEVVGIIAKIKAFLGYKEAG